MIAWLLTPLGRLLGGAAAVSVFLGIFAYDQRNRGAEKVIAKIERKDNAAAERIRKADDRSRAATPGRLRGVVRDPNSVSE
jgi:hypothetical protein